VDALVLVHTGRAGEDFMRNRTSRGRETMQQVVDPEEIYCETDFCGVAGRRKRSGNGEVNVFVHVGRREPGCETFATDE